MNSSKALWPLLFLLPIAFSGLFAQKPPMKFGQVEKAELQLSDCAFEPGAAALLLGNYAETEFTLTSGKGLALQMKRHKRIKIFSKNGLDQANVSLPYSAL